MITLFIVDFDGFNFPIILCALATAICLADVTFVTNPYELFLDYGNRIKARSKEKQTFIVQLCCGSHGYLPTEKAEKSGHYSAYVSSGYTGHEGGDLLTRESISQINKLFSN